VSKPFEPEVAAVAKRVETKLVEKLNSLFKRLRAEKGPGRECDNIILLLDGEVAAFLEIEVVSLSRWKRIKTKYPTVRWPISKKETCGEKEEKEGKPVFMASVPKDLSDIFVIDARTWISEGHEEEAPAVVSRLGGTPRVHRYRKRSGEKFWAIGKERVKWGFEGLEDYILSKLGLVKQL